MSRTRRRDYPQFWPWGRWRNLFFQKILKERNIDRSNYYNYAVKEWIQEKSFPNKLFFGKVYMDHKGSYKWVKKHENKKYRHKQKQILKRDYEDYIETKLVKYIDFYYGD